MFVITWRKLTTDFSLPHFRLVFDQWDKVSYFCSVANLSVVTVALADCRVL